MLKKKNAKKIMKNYKENARKVKCINCPKCDNCTLRKNKEKSENLGIITYCTLAPKKDTKPKNRKKRGIVVNG